VLFICLILLCEPLGELICFGKSNRKGEVITFDVGPETCVAQVMSNDTCVFVGCCKCAIPVKVFCSSGAEDNAVTVVTGSFEDTHGVGWFVEKVGQTMTRSASGAACEKTEDGATHSRRCG
jgi:hypothetical protein